jgi:aryl-alcohol dehydrogenase-like predicted oxidoreductase
VGRYWQWWKDRQLRRQLSAVQADRGGREVVLVLSSQDDISAAVRANLEQAGLQGLPLFTVHQPGAFGQEEASWREYLERMRGEVRKIRALGASRIHLFIKGPVVQGVFAGALLDNGPEVVVYHYFNGVYRPVGRLAHEAVKV